MRLFIKPTGIIRMYVSETELTVPFGLTIDQVLANLSIPAGLKLMIFVNGITCSGSTLVKDGDEIRIVTRMTGG